MAIRTLILTHTAMVTPTMAESMAAIGAAATAMVAVDMAMVAVDMVMAVAVTQAEDTAAVVDSGAPRVAVAVDTAADAVKFFQVPVRV